LSSTASFHEIAAIEEESEREARKKFANFFLKKVDFYFHLPVKANRSTMLGAAGAVAHKNMVSSFLIYD
jgi:hypothetical protein